MDTEKLVKFAKIAQSALVKKTRDTGETFYTITDNAPSWIQDVCREAHGDFMPDDTRYEFIVEALDAIIDNDGETDDIQLEADTYTRDLIAWLATSLKRVSYVDEAVSEFGIEASGDNPLISMLSAGQVLEKQETLNLLVSALDDLDEDAE